MQACSCLTSYKFYKNFIPNKGRLIWKRKKHEVMVFFNYKNMYEGFESIKGSEINVFDHSSQLLL